MGCGCGNSERDLAYSLPRKLTEDNSEGSPPFLPDEQDAIKQEPHLRVMRSQFILENWSDISSFYTLGELIGQGSFSTVYKATHKVSGETRAIKRIKRNSLDESKLFEEINILKIMDHPNIMRLYEVFIDKTFFYIVSEFIDGCELFDEIQRRTTSSEEIASKIMRQLISSVMYCHRNGIMHRDLKPENVMVDCLSAKRVGIKLIDFGTAHPLYSKDEYQPTTGTFYYIAPEVLMNNYNEKCDIWSCGVILYIMLSGKPPFNGSSQEDITRAVKRCSFSCETAEWRGVSEEAKELVRKMMRFPPTVRSTLEEIFFSEWVQHFSPEISVELLQKTLEQIETYKPKLLLEKIVNMYIVTQVLKRNQTEKLKEVFLFLDRDGDGRLSEEDLKYCFGYIKMPDKSKLILTQVDLNENSYIDYSEYLMAAVDPKLINTEENIRHAFHYLTLSGKIPAITLDSLTQLLGKENNPEILSKVIGEADIKKEGRITSKDFIDLLLSNQSSI